MYKFGVLQNGVIKDKKPGIFKSMKEKTMNGDSSSKISLLAFIYKFSSLQAHCCKLEETIGTLKEENTSLNQQNRDLKQQLAQCQEEINVLMNRHSQDMQELNSKLKNQELEIDSKRKEVENLVIRRSSKEIKSSVPFLSIKLNSLFQLKKQGWKVQSQCPEKILELEKTKLPVVSILGSTGSGKSWVANKLSSDQLSVGWQENSNSITLHYVPTEGGWFNLLDSSGWDEPIHLKSKELVDALPSSLQTNEENVSSINHQMRLHQILKDDAVLIERLKLFYMLRNADIILLVVSKLTDSEISRIAEVKSYLRELSNSSNSHPQMIIIHNLNWIYRIEEAQKLIENSLNQVFSLEEAPFFNTKTEMNGDVNINKNLFKDEAKFTHLIMAVEGSEAGNYYNPGAIKFLESKLNVLENKKMMPFCRSFAEFCSKELNRMIGTDLSVQYVENARIVATNKDSEILTSSLFHASGCESIIHEPRGEFKPKYSTKATRVSNGSEAHVTVEVEVLDSVIREKAVVFKDGLPYLKIRGTKKEAFSQKEIMKADERTVELNSNRQEGDYLLVIPLLDESMELKKDAKIEIEDVAPGIKQIRLKFQTPESIDI